MKKKTSFLFILLFVFATSLFLNASGFRPFELSARASALGGAFAAHTDDSSAIFYNPAALAFSSGIMAKINLFYPKMTTTAEYPEISSSAESATRKIIGSTFISWNIKERIGLGIGVFLPHSMENSWPQEWAGRRLSIRSKWNTVYIRPVVAVKICRFLSVGAGMDIISSNVDWKYEKLFTFFNRGFKDYVVTTHSDSIVEAKGIGYNASVLVRISENFHIGGRYQAKVKLDFDGEHNILFKYGDSYFHGILHDTTTDLSIPQEFVLGGMYSLGKRLTFQLDFQRIDMSEIKNLEFDLDPVLYEIFEDYYRIRPDPIMHRVDLNMRDISRIMFGVEYRFKNFLAIRAGYSHQKSAFASQMIHPIFVDLDTNVLSVGIGYDGPTFSVWDTSEKLGGITLDAFFQYAFSPKCSSALPEFPATYQTRRWIIGLGFGVTFGST